MPSALSPQTRPSSQEPDALNQILDYDNAVEDFLNDIPVRDGVAQLLPEGPRDEDQEVQVKRKRKPIPKLDEERLLSERGLPRLRKITKHQLKFRGKHHEFSDISKLLNTYQLWFDDLYPRAKFRDAVTIVEKLGHTKRMQVMRKGWLDSTKPNRVDLPSLEDEPTSEPQGLSQPDAQTVEGYQRTSFMEASDSSQLKEPTGQSGQDEAHRVSRLDVFPTESADDKNPEDPPEDELDALLSENLVRQPRQVPKVRRLPFEDDDQDELDALLAEQDGRERADAPPSHDQPKPAITHNDFADEEDVMAEMGGMW